MKLRFLLHGILVLCTLLCGAPALHAQSAGNLEPGFDPNVSQQGPSQLVAFPGVSVIVSQPDGKTIIGGNFDTVGTTACNGIARLNADGTLDTTFTSGLATGSNVIGVAPLQGGKLLVSSSDPTSAARHFNRLNADGSVDPLFLSLNYVAAMAVQADGKVVLAVTSPVSTTYGVITIGPGYYYDLILRLNADGSTDGTLYANVDGGSYYYGAPTGNPVTGMAVQADGKILVRGDFTSFMGQPRNHIARLNADGSLDANFDPGATLWDASVVSSGKISAMAVQSDGKIVLAGRFADASVSGQTVFKTVRINGDGTADATFNAALYALPSGGFGFFTAADTLSQLAVQTDGKIVVGGRFATVNGETRIKLARLNGDGSLESTTTFDAGSGIGSTIQSPPFSVPDSTAPLALVLQSDGGILVGGDFTTVNGQTRNRMARLLNDATSQTLTVVDATHVEWLRSGSAPEASQVAFQVSRDGGASWTTVGSGEHFVGGWRMAGTTLTSTGTIRAVAATPGGFVASPSQPFVGVPVFTVTTSVSPLVAYPWFTFVGVTPPPSGTVTGGGTVLAGSPVSVVATPAAGYAFVNWTENGTPVSTSATYDFTPAADRTLVANFALQSYTITTSVASAGSGVTRGGGTFTYGTWVSLVASPGPGYSFANWSENGNAISTSATLSFAASAPRTLVANFTLNTYTVGTVSSPSDGGTVTGGGTFSYGAPVRLVAVPAVGYQFANWSEDGNVMSWSTTLNFTATVNRTLTANFMPIAQISGGANFTGVTTFNSAGGSLYLGSSTTSAGLIVIGIGNLYYGGLGLAPVTCTITANASPSTGGWAVGAGNVYSGGSVTLLAVPAPGFTFVNWTENGTVVSTAAEYTFTATSNRTLSANFTGGSNASLGSLASDQATFTQAFDGNVTTYSTKVPVKTKYFTLSPTFAQDGATMTINGAAASPGGNNAAISLHLGNNTVAVEVTAPDGITKKTYTLNVARFAVPGDLDGDGTAELIFQNAAGQVGAWYMDASGKPVFSAFISSAALGDWKVVGTVDMNGDGYADVIYQNAAGQIYVWYMDGLGKATSGAFISGAGLGDWKVVAVADINGDGNADLVFQNNAGQIYVWSMDGHGAATAGAFLHAGGLGDWKIKAVADMNGDGNPDLIFQNSAGQIYAWYLNRQNGAAVVSTGAFLYGGGLGDWRVAAATDIDGDGKTDLVFQNNLGQIYTWHMNGQGAATSSAFIYSGGLGDWRIR